MPPSTCAPHSPRSLAARTRAIRQRGSCTFAELDGLLADLDETTFEASLCHLVQALGDTALERPARDPKRSDDRPRGLPSSGISRRYLRDLDCYPVMTREIELRHARRMEFAEARRRPHDGRPDSIQRVREAEYLWIRAEFIERSLHLVVSHAYAYRTYGAPLDDLIQEGNGALMRAVEKFDWRHGVRFRTYVAYWIRQAIERHLAALKGAVRVPHHLQQKFRRLKREGSLPRDRDAELTVDQLAKAFEISRDAAGHLLEASRPSFSLDQEISRQGETYRDFLVVDWEPLDSERDACLRNRISHLMDDLDDREQRVLEMRFGLDGKKSRTLEEVGKVLHLSRERSRQIQQRALTKLRDRADSDRLQEFLA